MAKVVSQLRMSVRLIVTAVLGSMMPEPSMALRTTQTRGDLGFELFRQR